MSVSILSPCGCAGVDSSRKVEYRSIEFRGEVAPGREKVSRTHAAFKVRRLGAKQPPDGCGGSVSRLTGASAWGVDQCVAGRFQAPGAMAEWVLATPHAVEQVALHRDGMMASLCHGRRVLGDFGVAVGAGRRRVLSHPIYRIPLFAVDHSFYEFLALHSIVDSIPIACGIVAGYRFLDCVGILFQLVSRAGFEPDPRRDRDLRPQFDSFAFDAGHDRHDEFAALGLHAQPLRSAVRV